MNKYYKVLSRTPKVSFRVGSVYVLILLLVFSFSPVLVRESNAGQLKDPKPNNPKIENKLELISKSAQQESLHAAQQQAQSFGLNLQSSRSLNVIVELEEGRKLSASSFGALDVEVLGRSDELYEIRVPINDITRLPEVINGLKYIRTPYEPMALGVEYGSNFSEGVNLTGGGLFHSKNLLGKGVKIAVIDVGFPSFDYAKEAGEFPEGTVVDKKDYTGGGFYSGTPHGTTVAALVHDMAPSSELYLKRIRTEVDLQEATEDAIQQGVDVIVHSVGWVNTNFGDGTGVIADITKKATENGVLWVNAAGNSARRHWEGKSSDRNGDGWVEFAGGSETITIDVDYASKIQLFLTWNDWPESDKDFDLILEDADGYEVSSSRNSQTGNQPPAESVSYRAPGKGSYELKVKAPNNASTGNTKLEIFSFNHQLDPFVKESSIMAPGNVEEVFTVGAINKQDWKDGEIEPFSSRGPTSDGRTKPDIAGPDGVDTYLHGNFPGTSATAPHAAGAAALILAREPDFSPEEISQTLKKQAQDRGEQGPDDVYGWGQMRLLYRSPSASRKFQPNSVEPGEKLTVTVEAQNPLTLQGGLKISEEVPEPLQVLKIDSPASASASNQDFSVEWPIVEPGKTKELKYSVRVPGDAPSGEYEFTGSVNGNSIGGATAATIGGNNDSNLGRDEGLVFNEVKTEKDPFTDRLDFQTTGENIEEIKVRVFSDTGKEIFDSGWQPGSNYQWGLYDDAGQSIPNGVYLYYVQVRGPNGEIERSDIQKYLVLR